MFELRNLSENDDVGGAICESDTVMDKSDIVNSKTINDILKYGAHQPGDNPIETQSEWSDEDERDDDEVKGTRMRMRFSSLCGGNYHDCAYKSCFLFKVALKVQVILQTKLA